MSTTTIPDAVLRFLLTSIPSVPYLEALLLLRSQPGRSWDSHNLAARLYIGEGQALELLDALQLSGMAARTADGGYAFAPTTQELAHRIDQLAHAYSHHLVSVTDLIHSRGEKRAHRFADAFRWDKDGS